MKTSWQDRQTISIGEEFLVNIRTCSHYNPPAVGVILLIQLEFIILQLYSKR